MKAAIYTPYLDTLGGGERYVISFSKVLLDKGWLVDLESKDADILSKLENRFGLVLKGLKVVESIKRGDGYDLCFWLSDGSIPTLFARRNFLHFQEPFYNVEGKSLLNRMKFFRIEKIIVNSKYTKEWIDREFPKESIVIYPPVDVAKLKSGKKENIILSVGRFSQLAQSKRQDVLLDVFKDLYDSGARNWKLVLAGGTEVGRTDFVDKLISNAKGYPVSIIEGPNFKTIKSLYAKAKFFWSASGYGIDEKRHPEKVEHFGMTVVEAMASGSLPLAFSAGGYKEIIDEGKNGYLWSTPNSLKLKTLRAMEDAKEFRNVSSQARKDSQKYSYESFKEEITKLI